MPKIGDDWFCPTCDKGAEEHSLALAIEHIYGGVSSKSGRDFDREESKEIADRVLGRLRKTLDNDGRDDA